MASNTSTCIPSLSLSEEPHFTYVTVVTTRRYAMGKKETKLGLEEKELKLQTHQNFNTSKNFGS